MNSRYKNLILSSCLMACVSVSAFALPYSDRYDSSSYFEAAPSADTGLSATQPTGYQTYTVKRGDTLGSISQKFFGTTTKWKMIASANNIDDPERIRVGQMLDIPVTDLDRGEGTLRRHRGEDYSSYAVETYDMVSNRAEEEMRSYDARNNGYRSSVEKDYNIGSSYPENDNPFRDTEYQGAVYSEYPPIVDLPPITATYFDSTSSSSGSYPTSAPIYSGQNPQSNLALPPVTGTDDTVFYSGSTMPQIILPGDVREKAKQDDRFVTNNGLTGLINTFSAYTLGKNVFSVGAGFGWSKINKRDGELLNDGEEGDKYYFPVVLTYSGENFEVGFKVPFESYDIYAPLTYNFNDGTDSGIGDCELRLKFCNEGEEMASCLGLGAIFPTSDIKIGNTDSTNAWELFAGMSTKRKDGGNIHLNAGYQAGDGNTAHEGIFASVGYDYKASNAFTFIGEVNYFDYENDGKCTDLVLGMRYSVKPGMSLSIAAPIALSNTLFFGYDYKIEGMLQYHY